jgi:hypothetical protein
MMTYTTKKSKIGYAYHSISLNQIETSCSEPLSTSSHPPIGGLILFERDLQHYQLLIVKSIYLRLSFNVQSIIDLSPAFFHLRSTQGPLPLAGSTFQDFGALLLGLLPGVDLGFELHNSEIDPGSLLPGALPAAV